MIFAEMEYPQDYWDIHDELVRHVQAHFSQVESGHQSDSWIWITRGIEKHMNKSYRRNGAPGEAKYFSWGGSWCRFGWESRIMRNHSSLIKAGQAGIMRCFSYKTKTYRANLDMFSKNYVD